jgi:protoporphyrinogen IX oxidase
MQVYLWLKAFHIAAAMTWISGMVAAGLVVASRLTCTGIQAAQDTRYLDVIRRWDRCVTLPAMLVAWGLGIVMAIQAGWFGSPWLTIKLAIVGALAALHGLLSGMLRRLGASVDQPPAALLYAAPATILGVVMIAILAVTKPF